MRKIIVQILASFIWNKEKRDTFRKKYKYSLFQIRTVNIAMICDNNYVMPTMVAIRSMVANKLKSTRLNIFVLGVNLSKENIINLNHMNKFHGLNINIIDKSYIIKDYENIDQNRHVTPAALLKFYLPTIFPNYDKILYLDSDIIVQNDLFDLFNTDISNEYGAVIKDTLCIFSRPYMESIGINNEFYFNSGVMLLNLKKMRDNNITEKLIDYRINVKQEFMDQDAFNKIIGYNVKYISYKYNFLNYYASAIDKKRLSEFFEIPYSLPLFKIYDSVTILHIGGKEKAWNVDLGYISILWYKYYSLLKEKINKKGK